MEAAFYSRLKTFIEAKGLNINEFSRLTGFSSGALSKILNGQKSFGIEKLMNIFISFPDLRTEWLLFGQGDMLTNPAMIARTHPDNVMRLEKENLQLSAKVEALQEILSQLMQFHPKDHQ